MLRGRRATQLEQSPIVAVDSSTDAQRALEQKTLRSVACSTF
jgi:hypothetical protein